MTCNKIQMVPFICLAVLAAGHCIEDSSSAQDVLSVVDEIRDFQDGTVVIQSLDQFRNQGSAFLTDSKSGKLVGLFMGMFQYEGEGINKKYDSTRPLVFYSDVSGKKRLIQLPVNSWEQVKRDFQKKVDAPFRASYPRFIAFIFRASYAFAIADDSHLGFAQDEQLVIDFANAPMLSTSLNNRFKKLFNESGMTAYFRVTDEQRPTSFESSKGHDEFTPEESETLRRIDRVVESAQAMAIGLTYEKRCVALQWLLAFKDHDAASEIFDFGETNRAFKATVGLPRKGLISTVSLNVETLRSPETARVIPKIIGPDLNGQSVGLAMQLLADAWHDVRGVRMGLYVAEGESQGKLCLVGVIDPRNPDSIVNELNKLVTLVGKESGEKSNPEQTAEIESLIRQLGSPEFLVRERASTRLVLAGSAAEKHLIKAASSGEAEVRLRARRALDEIAKHTETAAKKYSVDSIKFWANLRPQFSMENILAKYGSHDCYLLRIHPDPDKTENEVQIADKTMAQVFGESWDMVPMVRVGDQFVFLFGSKTELLDKAVANLKTNRDPIGSSQIIQNQKVVPGQLQVHFSLAQLINAGFFDGMKRNPWQSRVFDVPVEVGENNLTTMTFSLDPKTWGVNLHVPIEEIELMLPVYQNGLRGLLWRPPFRR